MAETTLVLQEQRFVLLCQAVLLLTAVLLFIIPFENPFKPFSKFSLIKHLLFVA
jgi:hypothetical protein